MNTKLIAGAVGVASMLGLTSVASATEHFSWYGSVRAGAVYSDPDDGTDALWDLGATGQDGTRSLYTRIGVRGSNDFDNGTSAGFHIQRNVGAANLSQRFHYVWIGGNWGRLTLGQQGNPYNSAVAWDQTWFLGSNFNGPTSRSEGIKYSSSLSGPVNFEFMVTGRDNTVDDNDTFVDGSDDIYTPAGESSVDLLSGGVSIDAGPVAVNFGLESVQTDNSGRDRTAVRVNGSFGDIGWFAAYQNSSDNTAAADDIATLAGYASFGFGDSSFYLHHATHSHDAANADQNETVIGYSRSLGSNTNFVTEYGTTEDESDPNDSKPSNLAIALMVSF